MTDPSPKQQKKFYGRYRDLIKQYEVSLSQMLNDILWPDHIQWQPPTDQTLYRTRHFTEFWVVYIEHLRRVWHADRGRLLLRTPGPVPLGLANVLLVETNLFSNLSLFYLIMLFEYPSVLSRFCFIVIYTHEQWKRNTQNVHQYLRDILNTFIDDFWWFNDYKRHTPYWLY